MYKPSQEVLEKYADLLVNFALGGGEGIAKGDVVHLTACEAAKPLYIELRKAVISSGGHVLGNYLPNEGTEYYPARDFLKSASDEQLNFFPEDYYRGLVDTIDHRLYIMSEMDKRALQSVDPGKLMKRAVAQKPYREWLAEKEGRGEFTWTLALYGTEAMAEEVNMDAEEYWSEIINACYLDAADPKAEWHAMTEKITDIKDRLNELEIESVHVESEEIDLHVRIGEKRTWKGGSGRNIPSYEIFTSPDWRGTEGTISFNQPLYRYGTLVEGISLEFKDGKVTSASAEQNEHVIKEMIATDGADKIGEFSLTDKRFSRISRFMGETLYEENVGAQHGNTHIALGRAYKDCYAGDPSEPSENDWEELGFNDSAIHTDMVSTTPRTVTATLADSSQQVIYKDGQFQV